MIIDKQNLFSEDQALTTTVASTNVVDLGADDSKIQDLNEKGLLEVLCQVTTALTGGTSVKATLQEDDAVGFGTATTVVETAAIAAASLVAGYKFKFGKLPKISKRYLRINFTIVGTFSAGNVFAALVLDDQSHT